MAKVMLKHPDIGTVRGKQGDGVLQFLGIKYGILADRFAPAELPTYNSDSVIDATKHGPLVLSPPDAVDDENRLIQLPDPLPFVERNVSDIDGLVVNITVPADASPTSKYPVLAWIHGGGLNIGSSNWPIYDASNCVRRSIENGTPIIIVGINYRLGVPGFLNSSDLDTAGYKANRGYRDQQLGLRWVQKYISGFGGDPENVTAGGQSAGAASVTYQMQSEERLFKRAILMSGSDLLMKATPPTDSSYDVACNILGLNKGSPENKVKELVSIPGLDMLGRLGRSVQIGSVADGDFIRTIHTPDGLLNGTQTPRAAEWMDSIMVGDCAFDGNILSLSLPPSTKGNATRFLDFATSVLQHDTAQDLARIYALQPSTPDPEAQTATLRFLNDIAFHAPTLAYATAFHRAGKRVHMYRFNARNAWPGPWEGEANHILDMAYLWGNYDRALPSDGARRVAVAMCDGMLAFVAGKRPFEEWEPLPGGGGGTAACVFGDEGFEVVEDVPERTGRRGEFLQLAKKVGFDALDAVAGAIFQHG